jgi:hypothetical protein
MNEKFRKFDTEWHGIFYGAAFVYKKRPVFKCFKKYMVSKVIVLWAKFTICIVLWGRHIITTLMYMHSNATIYVDSQQGPVIIVCMTMSWHGLNWRWNESNCYMCIFVRMLNFDRPSSQYDTYRKFGSQYYYFWYDTILHMYWIVISLLHISQYIWNIFIYFYLTFFLVWK